MPPRHPVSPLSLETISPSPLDLDPDLLVASDDDLDDNDRAARDQRIEKLAQTYLHGTPLFILSASLRGPLDNGWTNPWRKDRRKAAGLTRQQGEESDRWERPVIPETIPRKRPLYPSDTSRTTAAAPPSDPPRFSTERESQNDAASEPLLKRQRDSRRGTPSSNSVPKRTIQYKKAIGSSGQPDALTPLRLTDQSWLKKDRAGIGFRKVDPPTSPTATILSRHREEGHYTIQVPGTDYRVTTKTLLRARTNSRDDTTFDTHIPDSVKSQLTSRHPGAQSSIQGPLSDSEHQQNSLCVDRSTSHLPKFEYRRRKHSPHTENDATSPVSTHKENIQIPDDTAVAEDDRTLSQHLPIPPSPTSMQAIEVDMSRGESNSHNIQSKRSDTMDHQVSTQSRTVPSINNAEGANVSDRLPSAQQVSVNPAMTEHVTSLHTISAAKPNSECDNDTIPDLHFNTQAALLHAQKSFQKDLESQEHSQGAFKQASSPANDITPFHRMNPSDRMGKLSRINPPGTARMPMSTQCIIDAVTPFTFSTEKARPRFMSPQESTPSRMEPGSAGSSAASSSPSEHEDDDDDDPTILPLKSAAQPDISGDAEGNALPVILSDTNPTTYPDGQGAAPGADSFNLSQAIADAGSWLQQSFDINNEIQQCRSAKSRPSSSTGISRSAGSLDTLK
ncbi:uncharacterized protein BO80DRAFT_381345 [Aspergillus ibericus CBS 121593]|uniref:Protamine P1 n=1 Tax=Aspergillus ibericus CBS 121593 TaxID=1448316 RepID=A0A395H0I5_9EURO|nr:hypothetical protein BO80DRAFT_381345 [Aspergillus ibericus CBS 121593]RAL01306.1 hypothetical protein BO80DRAFT_381345 [Aspergillus ibericus CBS 121593]